MRRLLVLLVLFCFSLPVFAQEDEQTPYEIALQRIQEAEASGATELDLYGLGLTELPPEIGNLNNLQILDLFVNQLTNLPPEIGNLSNLQSLYLAANQLSILPTEIDNLTSLQSLDLSSNRFTSLPDEIGNLVNLQFLNLHHNQLQFLPPEIGNLAKLCYLDLHHNQLQYLPIELSRVERLREEYCIIDTYDNPLISPPQSVIEQGTPAILDYLENEAWWHLQRLIIAGATAFGIVAAFILGMRWRNRGKKKRA